MATQCRQDNNAYSGHMCIKSNYLAKLLSAESGHSATEMFGHLGALIGLGQFFFHHPPPSHPSPLTPTPPCDIILLVLLVQQLGWQQGSSVAMVNGSHLENQVHKDINMTTVSKHS